MKDWVDHLISVYHYQYCSLTLVVKDSISDFSAKGRSCLKNFFALSTIIAINLHMRKIEKPIAILYQ